MPRVLLEDVSLSYGAAQVVSGFSLDVAHGEFVTLLGPSGCGKTSTLRMIAGLQANSAGRITVGDMLVSDPQAGVFIAPERRHLGMVFQSYAIWPHMTVFENVAYPLRVRREASSSIAPRVMEALRLVDMQDYAQRPAPALSGGQQQRVAIARALVGEPAVLLLDEPLSNLDAKLRAQTGEEFRSLQRRLGITTIYVTHDQEEAMTLSDRIVLMQAGKIQQAGPPVELYRRPVDASVAAFFGSPNLLRADVLASASDQGRCNAELQIGQWQGRCPSPVALQPLQQALVVARPEDIRLAAPGQPQDAGDLILEASVTDTVFRGGRATVVLDAGGLVLKAEVPALQTPAVGDRVQAVIPLQAMWCVPAGT